MSKMTQRVLAAVLVLCTLLAICAGVAVAKYKSGIEVAEFNLFVDGTNIPERLVITIPPDKTSYIDGEDFDPQGMEVTVIYTDGTSKVVIDYTIEDGEDLDSADQDSVTVSYTENGVTVTTEQEINISKVLERIEVTKAPKKTSYYVGDDFEPAGMEVTAYYTDGSSAVVTGYIITNGDNLETDQNSVTVSYTEGGITRTATTPITVSKKAGLVELSEYSGTLAYPSAGTFEVTTNLSGGELSVSTANTKVATAAISGNTVTVTPGTTSGKTTITVTSAETDSYYPATATYTVTVENGALTVVSNGYTGVYDGKAHSISVACDGATITYSADGITFGSTNPAFTNVGTYNVYYKVAKAGYDTVTSYETVTITKAAGSVILSENSGTLTYPTAGTFNVKSNLSGGTLSVATSNSGIATATISGNTVTVTPGTTASTTVITVTSAATANYEAASATYTVTVKNGKLSISSADYTGTYDGKAHGISVVCDGATITYSADGTTYSTTNPTYTNAGIYTTYYKVEKVGYDTYSGSATVTINKADGSVILANSSGTLVYPNAGSVIVQSNISGGALSVATSSTSIATASVSGDVVTINPGTTEGIATITVTAAETENYKAASATYEVTVNNGVLSISASGYTGTYDGKAHSISVACDGATITYSKDGVTYSSDNPTYSDVGTYTTYYKVEMEGYETATGSETITIEKAAGSVVLSASSGSLSYPNTTTFEVTENLSGGTLSVKSSDDSIASATISGNTVTVASGTIEGTAMITVTSAATSNYEEASATYTIEVGYGILSVTASGYTGTYDGKAHGITVECDDATITYSEDGYIYSSTNPTYTNAGTYTVYYKVEKDGYDTVTGSADVTINKAAGSLILSDEEIELTYPNTATFTVVKNLSGGTLSSRVSVSALAMVQRTGADTFLITPRRTANSSYTFVVQVQSAETTNYTAATATIYVTLHLGNINVTATDYTGVYDGEAHSITVTSDVGTITYSTDGTTYSSENPTFTDVGVYTVYYQVAQSYYITETGTATVTIEQADGKVTLSESEGSITRTYNGDNTTTFTVTENLSGGTLTVKTTDGSVATATVDGNTVTVTAGSSVGTAEIAVFSAATQNYKQAHAVYTVTVSETPTAFLYEDGTMVFQSSSTPDTDTYGAVTASYTGWDTAEYTSNSEVPWKSHKDYGAITSVIIEDDVYPAHTAYWFYYCEDGLTSAKVGAGVTSLDYGAFGYCYKLTDITLSEGLESINRMAFAFTDMLEGIELPDSLTTIGLHAFAYSGLTEVHIPVNVSSIDDGAFCECYELAEFTVDEDNQYFTASDDGLLLSKDTTMLVSFTHARIEEDGYAIPSYITKIQGQAFRGSQYIEGTLTIHDGVTYIGEGAFGYALKITDFKIDANDGNGKLADNIGSYYSVEDGVLYSKDFTTLLAYPCGNGVTSLTIKDTVTRTGGYSFHGHRTLQEVIVPDNVLTLGRYTFSETIYLTYAYIGSGVTCIEPGVFQRISPLNAIVFAETSGWYVTPTEGGTSGIAVDVSDSSAVITYLDTNYRALYWYRN